MDLIARRVEMRADFLAMEKYDPHWKELAAKGDKISERPVVFVLDGEMLVIGDDVPKVLAGLADFLSRADVYRKRAKAEPVVATALAKCERLLEQDPAEIRVPSQVWNCYSFGLNEAGVNAVLTDGE